MTTPATYGSVTADPGVGPQPSNGIIVSGTPDVQWLKIENATNMYPSRLVKKGTNDGEVLVCGAGEKGIGFLGYEHATKKDRPATRDTIYTVSVQAPVLKGKATVILGYLAQAQTVVKGDKLVAAAAGMLSLASAAKFATSTAAAVLGGTASPTVAGNISTEGPIVATAEESVATTDAEGFIMITPEI